MEARLRAEELARIEAQARQAAERQSQEMEREVVGLQSKNLELNAEVQRLTELLHQEPKARSSFVYVHIPNRMSSIMSNLNTSLPL